MTAYALDTAREISEVMTSGLSGRQLLDELMSRFGDAKRYDVFLGISIAVTLMQADLTIATETIRIMFPDDFGTLAAQDVKIQADSTG